VQDQSLRKRPAVPEPRSYPKISVVIPTYQCEEYVGQALESVLTQRYPEGLVEIIVVDDGSTDNTRAVLQPNLGRIRYIYQSNRGEAAARNAGVNAASCNFIAFLDADDYWLPDRLRLMAEALDGRTDRLVVTDYFTSIAGRIGDIPEYQRRGLRRLFELEPAEQLKAAVEDNFISWPLLPRDVFDELGLFDESLHYGTDWDMWLRCLAANRRVELVPQGCVIYRLYRPGSSTARNDYSKASDRVRVLARYRKHASKRRWMRALGAMHHVGFRESLAAGAYGAALGHVVPLFTNPVYLPEYLFRKVVRPKELIKNR